ncbi:MAG: hypothetical protein WCF23_24015 [Candidatus Nitrosopolaris sp.]
MKTGLQFAKNVKNNIYLDCIKSNVDLSSANLVSIAFVSLLSSINSLFQQSSTRFQLGYFQHIQSKDRFKTEARDKGFSVAGNTAKHLTNLLCIIDEITLRVDSHR